MYYDSYQYCVEVKGLVAGDIPVQQIVKVGNAEKIVNVCIRLLALITTLLLAHVAMVINYIIGRRLGKSKGSDICYVLAAVTAQ
jgi:hypothetical protein